LAIEHASARRNMNYHGFLLSLNKSGWKIEGKSYAFTAIGAK
jgi:hypothetical protein